MRAAWQPAGTRSSARSSSGCLGFVPCVSGCSFFRSFSWSTARARVAPGGGARLRPRLDLRPPGLAVAARRDRGSVRSRSWRRAPWSPSGSGSGTLVASPNFRHPVPFARELVTLDDVSGGRLTLGIGAGGGGWDAVMLGQDPWSPSERAERFAEFLDVLDRLLREPEASYRGTVLFGGRGPDVSRLCAGPRGSRSPWPPPAAGECGSPPSMAASWVTTGDLGPEGSLLGVDEGVRSWCGADGPVG